MSVVVQFPNTTQSKGLQRVQATYTVREISRQFGLSEHSIRRWTREGLFEAASTSDDGELQYDFRALTQFRRVRELRSRGLTTRQIEAELRGQLNLFPERGGRLLQLPIRLSPFEEALILHERGESRAVEMYMRAIHEGECVSDAYCNLGIMECRKGNTSRAFNCFTNSLENDPRHFESHYNVANLYFEAGDLRLARLHYEIAAEIKPDSPSVYFNLGLVHAMKENFKAAVAALSHYKELALDIEDGHADQLLSNFKKSLITPG